MWSQQFSRYLNSEHEAEVRIIKFREVWIKMKPQLDADVIFSFVVSYQQVSYQPKTPKLIIPDTVEFNRDYWLYFQEITFSYSRLGQFVSWFVTCITAGIRHLLRLLIMFTLPVINKSRVQVSYQLGTIRPINFGTVWFSRDLTNNLQSFYIRAVFEAHNNRCASPAFCKL